MRHGNGCVIEGNVFNGNHRKQTGGIRIIGEDHVVKGNYLSGIEGEEARSAICLQNGIEGSPANGYFQVKRAVVDGNSILDCKHSITIGYADKDVKAMLPPVDCHITRQLRELRGQSSHRPHGRDCKGHMDEQCHVGE